MAKLGINSEGDMAKTAHEDQTDYNYRATALGYAAQIEKGADSAEQVIESAKKFEAYLRGDHERQSEFGE